MCPKYDINHIQIYAPLSANHYLLENIGMTICCFSQGFVIVLF